MYSWNEGNGWTGDNRSSAAMNAIAN